MLRDSEPGPPPKLCAGCDAETPWEVWTVPMCGPCAWKWEVDSTFDGDLAVGDTPKRIREWCMEQRKARKAA